MAEVSERAALERHAMPAPGAVRRDFARVRQQSAIVGALLRGDDRQLTARAEAVSGWSVAQQLEHLLRVERSVLAMLHRILDPAEQSAVQGINALGRAVLLTGFMPRGVAKAPAAALPNEEAMAAASAAAAQLTEVDRRIDALGLRLAELARPRRSGLRLAHPRFGSLDGPQWLRFLGIHSHHHLKIVRDIRRARGLTPGLPRG
jgi:DinB superfamily